MKNKEEQILDQVNKASRILITAHAPWNEEAITNALALKMYLAKLDKKCDIVMENGEGSEFLKPSRENFSIFKGFQDIKKELKITRDFTVSINISDAEIENIKYKINENHLNFFIRLSQGDLNSEDIQTENTSFDYDLIIVLNTPDLELLGDLYKKNPEFFYNTPIINIDNQPSNEEYGQVNLVQITSVSVAESLYCLFTEQNPELMDEEIATCLLGSIIYKTKNFKTFVTPNILNTTSQLISCGGDKERIIDKFYRSRNLNALKLWGRALNNLSSLKGIDNKLIWTTLQFQDFRDTETTEKELIDLVDEIVIHIPKVNVVVVFYEKEKENGEKTRNFLIYSHKNINLKTLLKEYSPAGNEKVIQARSSQDLEAMKKSVISSLLESIKKTEE